MIKQGEKRKELIEKRLRTTYWHYTKKVLTRPELEQLKQTFQVGK